MSNKDCTTWVIADAIKIPYGHPPRSFKKMCRKIINTILSHWAYVCPSNGLRIMMHRWRGCHIGKGVYIGRYCMLDNMYPEYIYIYDGASINAESMILTHFNPYETWKKVFSAEVKPVVIGENAIVSVKCTIMPGVTMGKYSVVSGGMVIDKSIPAYTMMKEKRKQESLDIKFLFEQ